MQPKGLKCYCVSEQQYKVKKKTQPQEDTQPFSLPFIRRDEERASAEHENGAMFIAAQLQQTLADLDEELEGMGVCNF